MAKRWKKKNQKRKGDQRGKKGRDDSRNKSNRKWIDPKEFQEWVYSSPTFESYYKLQNIVPESEWVEFMAVLQDPLPACFRVNLDCPFKEKLRDELNAFAQDIIVNMDSVEQVMKLSWYPYDDCYQFGCDRRAIRKAKNLSGLKQWLADHTNSGHITRQEAVSMVPPCFLDVQPHHKVLDMCASPGSKTCQILEMLHRPPANKESLDKVTVLEPTGVCVANDVDQERAYMLVHQCKRISSPALIVTCCPAQQFPSIREVKDAAASAEYPDAGFFDRVLADVPCSGDGTLRKQPSIWRTWSTSGGFALHPLQLHIALRGASLLKVGGLLVYSTCSLNPLEDEAVVAELLRRAKGCLELVDTKAIMPTLKRRDGLHFWHVVEDKGRLGQHQPRSRKRPREGSPSQESKTTEAHPSTDTLDEEIKVQEVEDVALPSTEVDVKITDEAKKNSLAPETPLDTCKKLGFRIWEKSDEVPEASQRRVRASMFPPSPEEAEALHLERCMRFVPHDQNTGGFFVALIRKTAPIHMNELLRACDAQTVEEKSETTAIPAGSDEKKETASTEEQGDSFDMAVEPTKVEEETQNQTPGKGRQKSGQKRSSQEKIKEEYLPLKPGRFDEIRQFYGISPAFKEDQLYVRTEGAKTIYYVTETVKRDFLDVKWSDRIEVIKTGLKIFEKNSHAELEHYRICQEGAAYVLPHVTRRVVHTDPADFLQLLKGGQQYFDVFSSSWVEKVQPLHAGVFVVLLQTDRPIEPPLSLIAWRGRSPSVNLMVNKKELHSQKELLAHLGFVAEARPDIAKDVEVETPANEQSQSETPIIVNAGPEAPQANKEES